MASRTYIDITQRFNDTFKKEKPQVGKYRASGLYYLLKEPPENFFNPREFTMAEKAGMWRGTGKHKMIQELLPDCECELEKIMKYDGFELSGHCDVITPQKEIWDIKTSRNGDVRENAYASQIYQLRLYLTMFECNHGKIVQPMFDGKWSLKLKVLAEVERSDEWFEGEMAKLADYHKKLIQLI